MIKTVPPLLSVRGLTKKFGGVTVVDNLDLVVESGQVVALVGANGVGKTTVLNCIIGSERADGGTVSLAGRLYDEVDPDTRRAVCSLLDDWAWFPDLTVREHLEMYSRAHDVLDERRTVDRALTAVGIELLGDRLPSTLSSGQTRRFALAQALVRPWRLLVLDEPEQRLDSEGRRWLSRYLREVSGEGRGVLVTSHDDSVLAGSGAVVHRLGRR